MPLYKFHLNNGQGFLEDEEGRELADDDSARERAVQEARALMAEELRQGQVNLAASLEVERDGQLLFTLAFDEVVAFIR